MISLEKNLEIYKIVSKTFSQIVFLIYTTSSVSINQIRMKSEIEITENSPISCLKTPVFRQYSKAIHVN